MPYRKRGPKQLTVDSLSNTNLKVITQNYSLRTKQKNVQAPQLCTTLIQSLLNNSALGYTKTHSDPCTGLNSPYSVENMFTNLFELPIAK